MNDQDSPLINVEALNGNGHRVRDNCYGQTERLLEMETSLPHGEN
jgi:hypothetical protein